MLSVVQLQHHPSLIDDNHLKYKSWLGSLLIGDLEKYRSYRRKSRVAYWWVERDEANTITRKIGFDVHKRPVSGLGHVKLVIDTVPVNLLHQIDSTLFEDMWSMFRLRDFQKLCAMQEKYLELWKSPIGFDPPEFPCLLISIWDGSVSSEIASLEELNADPDLLGYEWETSDRLLDAQGKIYKTAYYNFGHPVGVVVPVAIERRLTEAELMDVMNGVKFVLRKI